MARSIIGRSQELEILQEICDSSDPQFFALYGRRRIGKTFLISEFFKDKGLYFEITGTKNASVAQQLFYFTLEFTKKFNQGVQIPAPKNWPEAFNLLEEAVEKSTSGTKVILFFDELPWLATPRSNFLNSLEHSWNRYLSRHNNVILIICGSSASWIIRNIINNKGGLHGRVTRKMRLLPFTLSETKEFFESKQIALDKKQIIDIYMAMGGVPKYLTYVSRGKSAAQNINDICFSNQGGLFGEFTQLYQSLFDNYEYHVAIVKALSRSIEGLTKQELLEKVKLSSGGASSRIIEELEDAGFIIYIPSFNNKKKGGIYRLIDEYSLFYLTWIAEKTGIGLEVIDTSFWMKKFGSPKWKAWSGCAFEAICLKHIQKIKRALGISGISTVESGWRFSPAKGTDEVGAQIDLVIDRADRCINLCEMKYSESEFILDKSYAEKLRIKKRVFKEQTGSSKTLFTTMLTTYGTKKNSHYLSVVDNQLTMEVLF